MPYLGREAVASKSRSNLPALVDRLFRNPFVTVTSVQRALGLTNQGARNLIREAERRGWLAQAGAPTAVGAASSSRTPRPSPVRRYHS